MPGYFREIAVRMFAKELKDSDLVYREEEEQYAPQYVLTPTGAKANRVLISGVLTEVENIGTSSEYYRARIADPTGIFTIYAGQYQSEAARFLSEAETPSFVTIVGKVTSFTTDDGNTMLSIRPEYIQKADEKDRSIWTAETAEKTYERIIAAEAQAEAAESEEKGGNENIKNALKHYTPEFTEYRKMIVQALETISASSD
ncbi:MAG: DNA-binding protein [Methanosarcinales archaeon]|jgi:RPA family protein|nr:DNA-binding protein [Methanosarcinales archaeon]